MEIENMALGQGGLSDEPMWGDRIAELRSLQPKLIRLFVQEYFNLLPELGHFQFESLDRSVDNILATGAKPLMCICFKPRALFSEVNQDIVEPSDYRQWENLIYELVKHYQNRRSGIQFWEIANEPDIGEDGGCPYRFKPENYVSYYLHTVTAILRADVQARVGGPALASSASPILPTLLSFCETNHAPLDFVSWHIYSSDPQTIRSTVEHVRNLLKQHPSLKVQTVLDEWNMDLMHPELDPSFQPCFVCETVWQMKEAKLDYSCYYHIRDWHVRLEQFRPFMSGKGAGFMTRWWNRMPQFDGLFDYQNHVRPTYYAFKLLSRLSGERFRTTSDHPAIHSFGSHDEQLQIDNLVLWNFSPAPVEVQVILKNIRAGARFRHLLLDAAAPDTDENSRLRPDPYVVLDGGEQHLELKLEPYAIHHWSVE
jgi:hypothetical protein